MSNAAVIKLIRKKLPGKEVWLDDNFAESIHIHINDFRCDLTCHNFSELCEEISAGVNQLVDIEGFDIQSIDPVFFQQSLYSNVMYLTTVKIDKVMLSDLWVYDGRLRPLKESHVMKGLEGDEIAGNMKRKSDHENQSGMERILEIDESIRKNGYPMEGKYIIVYNNENVIRDGQHRACSLFKAYGDIEIPVMRLYFSNYKDIDIKKQSTVLGEASYRIKIAWSKIKNVKQYSRYFRIAINTAKDKFKGVLRIQRRKLYIWSNRQVVEDAMSVFNSK